MAAHKYWKIALGSQWLPLDDTTARGVSYLWSCNQSGFIQSSTFKGFVYVDFDYNMAIIHNEASYAIAYC
jgi:hypothetical protein